MLLLCEGKQAQGGLIIKARRLSAGSTLGLSSAVLVSLLVSLPALLTAYAIPGLATAALFFTDAWLAAQISAPDFLPNWLFQVALSVFAAAALVPLIRHHALGEDVNALPKTSLWKAILWVALLHYAAWMLLGNVVGANAIYDVFLQSRYYDEMEMDALPWIRAAANVISFGLSVLLVALIYPLIGLSAIRKRLEPWTVLSWQRQSFAGILSATAILSAAFAMIEVLYWQALHPLTPDDLWHTPTLAANFNGRHVFLQELLAFPLDFLRTAVSAIAIAKLVNGLGIDRQVS